MAAPTPDFYSYTWTPPATVEIRGRFVHITWDDGATLEAFDLWLRENAVGSGVDSATREGLMDPAEHDAAESVSEAVIDPQGAVRIRFANTPEPCIFHPGWLRHVADGLHRPAS